MESRVRARVLGPRQTPDGLEQRLLARARAAGLRRGDGVVVAFSGGRDSLALAVALRRTLTALDLQLILIHVDHRLRLDSGEEAARAARLAAGLGLDVRILVVSSPPPELHPHVGVEEAARRERYRILFGAAAEAGARVVATAHHERDQAETVLLHLLRGGGVHGAAGMSERSAPPYASRKYDISPKVDKQEPWLWRPFLKEPRTVIDAYVTPLGLDWIEDPSNDDLGLRRNVLRHQILPLLEKHFTGATAALARYGRLAAADDEVLEQLAQTAIADQVDPGGRLAAAALQGHAVGVQRRVLRRWLTRVTGSRAVSAERTDAVLDLIGSGVGNKGVEIGAGWTVCLQSGMLHAWKPGGNHEEAQ